MGSNKKTVFIILSLLLVVGVVFGTYVSHQNGEKYKNSVSRSLSVASRKSEEAKTRVLVSQDEVLTSSVMKNLSYEVSSDTKGLSLPLICEKDKLEIVEIGTVSGAFVEAGEMKIGTKNIAAIKVKNISNRHLSYAVLVFETAGGTRLTFSFSNIPAGDSVIVCEFHQIQLSKTENLTLKTKSLTFNDIKTEYDTLSLDVQESMFVLQNKTGKNLEDIKIYYKYVMPDGTIFAGDTFAQIFISVKADSFASEIVKGYSHEYFKIVGIDIQ